MSKCCHVRVSDESQLKTTHENLECFILICARLSELAHERVVLASASFPAMPILEKLGK